MTSDRISGAFLALFALGVIWESRALPMGSFREPGPAYMPVLLALLLFAFGLLTVLTGGQSKKLAAIGWEEWPHAAAILSSCVFASLALERIGYRLTVLLTCLFLLKGLERKGWLLTLVFALGMAFGSFFLFHNLLRVPLPLSPLGL